MTAHDHSRHEHGASSGRDRFWTSRTFLVFLGFAAIAGFLLLSEHRAHALGALPFLLLLACPLLHVFMHRGHGGHGSHDDTKKPDRDTKGDRS